MFDIIGVLDEHCVESGFIEVSNMLNLGPAADSDNNFGVGGGNICDEAEHYELKSTGPGPAMFSGPINTDFGLTSLG